MTETLHTALDQLLRALEEERAESPDGDRLALLRARLLADLSEALAEEGPISGLDDTTLLNEIAAHLDGLPLPDREALIAVLTQSARGRAALQSAATFLADVDGEAPPISVAQLDDAMAVFAPEAPRVAAAVEAARPRAGWLGRRVGAVQGLAGLAALLLVGIVGGSQLWHFSHLNTAPVTSPKAALPRQEAAPQPNAGGEVGVQQPEPAGALAPSDNNCDLTAQDREDRLVKNPSASQLKSVKEQKAAKRPCLPVPAGEPAPASPQPNLPSGGDHH